MRNHLLFFLLIFTSVTIAQDSIKILFVYGSRPKTRYEPKWFGGIHGGHSSVQFRKEFISFIPSGEFHFFSKDSINSKFIIEKEDYFVYDTLQSRYLIISIPVDSMQLKRLDSVCISRIEKSPYDYAFFGMRCASAAYELMSSAGIFPKMNQRKMVRKYFYCKRLRKMLMKKAKANHWHLVYAPGRKSRKWEKN